MSSPEISHQSIDQRVRAAGEAGEWQAAATVAIERYGPEILGFIGAIVGEAAFADDAFSLFCEDAWRGLPSFEWRSSVRAWCYTLARHAAMRVLIASQRRTRRHLPISQVGEVAALVAKVRSTTIRASERSEVKHRMRQLREQLPVDDQVLLVLRVDKDLPWSDVVAVLAEEGEVLDGEELERRSAQVRKRFQYVKEKLRRMAHEAGLL